MRDVRDTGASYLEKAIPVSQTNATTSVQTNSSRLETHPRWVGLACVRQAPSGGGSRLVSAVAVHDHLAAHQPSYRNVVKPSSEANALALTHSNAFAVFSQAHDGP